MPVSYKACSTCPICPSISQFPRALSHEHPVQGPSSTVLMYSTNMPPCRSQKNYGQGLHRHWRMLLFASLLQAQLPTTSWKLARINRSLKQILGQKEIKTCDNSNKDKRRKPADFFCWVSMVTLSHLNINEALGAVQEILRTNSCSVPKRNRFMQPTGKKDEPDSEK